MKYKARIIYFVKPDYIPEEVILQQIIKRGIKVKKLGLNYIIQEITDGEEAYRTEVRFVTREDRMKNPKITNLVMDLDVLVAMMLEDAKAIGKYFLGKHKGGKTNGGTKPR